MPGMHEWYVNISICPHERIWIMNDVPVSKPGRVIPIPPVGFRMRPCETRIKSHSPSVDEKKSKNPKKIQKKLFFVRPASLRSGYLPVKDKNKQRKVKGNETKESKEMKQKKKKDQNL